MIYPFCVNPPGRGEQYAFVGGGVFISRTGLNKRRIQADVISRLFGFRDCALSFGETGASSLRIDGETYNVSHTYTKTTWYFALSCYPLGFDVIDQRDAPNRWRDLRPLLAASLPEPIEKAAHSRLIQPHLAQICAAEAIGKILGVGLTRDILRAQLLAEEAGQLVPRSPLVVRDRPLHLLDVSERFQQPHRLIAMIAVPA